MKSFTRFLLVSAGVVGGVLFARGPLPQADAAVPTRSTGTHVHTHTSMPRHMHVPQHRVPHTVHIHRTRYLPTYVSRVYFYRQYKSNRLSGRKSYVVQVRMGGWGKTGMGPRPVAEVLRYKMQSAGYSAHLHNTSKGSFVHYHGRHWHTHSVHTSHRSAELIAAALRSRGLSARVTQRS